MQYQELQTRLTASLIRIDALDSRIDTLIQELDIANETIAELRLDLGDAQSEQRLVFLRGMGVGAGVTGVTVLIIWLVSALRP